MAELVPLDTLDPAALRRALRRQLSRLGLRDDWCVEDILGTETPIDLVACDPQGRPALVLVTSAGSELRGVGLALAQRAFVAERIDDWKKLAPGLPLRSDLGVRLLLVGQDFGPQTRGAAAGLRREGLELWQARALQNGSGFELWLEPICRPDPPRPAADPPGSSSPFRTGLSDADLGLTPGEIREFD